MKTWGQINSEEVCAGRAEHTEGRIYGSKKAEHQNLCIGASRTGSLHS